MCNFYKDGVKINVFLYINSRMKLINVSTGAYSAIHFCVISQSMLIYFCFFLGWLLSVNHLINCHHRVACVGAHDNMKLYAQQVNWGQWDIADIFVGATTDSYVHSWISLSPFNRAIRRIYAIHAYIWCYVWLYFHMIGQKVYCMAHIEINTMPSHRFIEKKFITIKIKITSC